MMRLLLSQVATAVGGRLVGDDVEVFGVSTDTRTAQPGELLIALSGPRFDAHEYITADLPVAGLLVAHPIDVGTPQVLVGDTRQALADLAHFWAQQCPARRIALTGSNGKTSTKEMLATILRREGHTLYTQGNLNNEIGVPLTLLRLDPEHQFAVIEMGANHAGEIARLTQIAQPHVALITNAGPAHLEGFGSIEGVAHAKAEIYQGLGTTGIALVNADDDYADLWCGLNAERRMIRFGFSEQADVRGVPLADGGFAISLAGETVAVDLPLAGQHNRMNALAAAAAASAVGVRLEHIAEALANLQPVPGRLKRQTTPAGWTLIDDSYNANPASTRAAIDVLAAEPGYRVLVLGDMGELGADAESMHAGIGAYAAACGIDVLYGLGPLSAHAVRGFGAAGRHFMDIEELIEALQRALSGTVSVLVKGSRSARMERVVEALCREAA